MSKRIDLTGLTFSKLKVLKLDEKRTQETGRGYWFCQCSCSKKNIKSISGKELRKNRTKSCGCHRIKKLVDIVGKTYGKLEVIKYIEKDKNGHHTWLCQCDCPRKKRIPVTGGHLKSGHTTSCGCEHRVNAIKIGARNLINGFNKKVNIKKGDVFNYLIAIKESNCRPHGNRYIHWWFSCSCGEIVCKPKAWVINENTKSCGHLEEENRKNFGSRSIQSHETKQQLRLHRQQFVQELIDNGGLE